MKFPLAPCILSFLPLLAAGAATVAVGYSEGGAENFQLAGVPTPKQGDAAAKAVFTIVDGTPEGALKALSDGMLPSFDDEPSANFFFGSQGSQRLQIDLGSVVPVKEFNTYSWHSGTRGPQVYKLYASDGTAPGFDPQPKSPQDPAKCGWKWIADVDTRTKAGGRGGQYGVSVSNPPGGLGAYRYFLMDISSTTDAAQCETFFSEIDVIDRGGAALAPAASDSHILTFDTADRKARFSILYGDAPDLDEWIRTKLAPAVRVWYPKISELLKSPGYTPPQRFTIKFTNEQDGVAVTFGTHIQGNPSWYRTSLGTEATGSMVHELVHVVQQYGRAHAKAKTPAPTWLSEGIADYVRWELYEPKPRFRVDASNLEKIGYDHSYQESADFLKWTAAKYNPQLIPLLNRAAREGVYDDAIWKKLTGHTAPELGAQWKAEYARKLGVKLPDGAGS